MNWDTIQQFVRIIMQVLAGMLVSRGYITADMAVTLSGAVISLAGIGWWVFWDRKRAA